MATLIEGMVKHGNLVPGSTRCYHCGEIAALLRGGRPLCRVCAEAKSSLDKTGSTEVPLKESAEGLADAHRPFGVNRDR